MKPNFLNTSLVQYEGVDFINTNVNEILLHNIVSFLKGNEEKSSDTHILPNGLKIHRVSRAGYRIIELNESINNDESFAKFLAENKDDIYNRFYYAYCGHFTYEGKYYLIVSKEKEDKAEVRFGKIRLGTLASIDSIMNKKK